MNDKTIKDNYCGVEYTTELYTSKAGYILMPYLWITQNTTGGDIDIIVISAEKMIELRDYINDYLAELDAKL